MDTYTFSIAGTAYKSFAEAFHEAGKLGQEITTGTYYAHGDVAPAPVESAPLYHELEVSFPGVDGVGIKRMGFRGRHIKGTLCVAQASKTDAETVKNTLFAAITPLASFSVTIPGGTARSNCRLVPGSGQPRGWLLLAGMYVLLVDVEFRQMRE